MRLNSADPAVYTRLPKVQRDESHRECRRGMESTSRAGAGTSMEWAIEEPHSQP
jgi:hypothetical protein